MTGSSSAAPAPPPESSPGDRLDSWKEIAAYFNRDKRTVQRWERQEGMPVHRHLHDKQGSVYAIKAELDEWWKGRRARIEREEQAEKTKVLNWPIPGAAIRTPVPTGVKARYEALAEMGSGGMGVFTKRGTARVRSGGPKGIAEFQVERKTGCYFTSQMSPVRRSLLRSPAPFLAMTS